MLKHETQDERKALEVQRKRKADDEAIFKKAQDLKERKKIELITALEEQSKIHHQRKIEEKKYMDEQVRHHELIKLLAAIFPPLKTCAGYTFQKIYS